MNHLHTLPAGSTASTPEQRIEAMRANCPVCSKHDHSDKRPFGTDQFGIDVPGWWFNCPECGTSESQIHLKHWLRPGLEWIKDNPDFVSPIQAGTQPESVRL